MGTPLPICTQPRAESALGLALLTMLVVMPAPQVLGQELRQGPDYFSSTEELQSALFAEAAATDDIWLAQAQPAQPRTQPPPRRTPPTGPSAAERAAAARRRALYGLASVPNMFGDFYTGSMYTVAFTPAPTVFNQTWNDGVPFDLFVQNAGGVGANIDPTIPINIFDVGSGTLLATSIANGVDGSGDGQPDTYQISEPVGSRPAPNLAGTVVYNGGVAVFVGVVGPNTQTQPVDGSVDSPDGWNLVFSHLFTPNATQLVVSSGGGGAVRRVKLSENNSPEPRDRLLFNYHFFNDAFGGIGDVNRYTVGVEKTFLNGANSIEIRLPFASTLADDQFAGVTRTANTEFGNLNLIYKHLLLEGDNWLVSGGLGLAAPTAGDTRVLMGPGGPVLLQFDNQAVHLLPFIAAMTHSDRFFAQAFLQLDVDVNGNPVLGDVTGANPTQFGVLQDATLMFVDVGMGYLLFSDPSAPHVTRVSAIAEAHYATTLQNADVAAGNGFVLNNLVNRFDVVNLSFGADIVLHDYISVRPAMVVPMRTGANKQFDYEANVQVNVNY